MKTIAKNKFPEPNNLEEVSLLYFVYYIMYDVVIQSLICFVNETLFSLPFLRFI